MLARYVLDMSTVSLKDMIGMFRRASRERGQTINLVSATMILTRFLELLNESGALKQVPEDAGERLAFFGELVTSMSKEADNEAKKRRKADGR